MNKVIAIDGPSGAGKSAVAKLVAEKLGFQFFDTGALYRAVALHLRRMTIKPDSPDAEVAVALSGVNIKLKGDHLFLNDENVSEAIRTTETGHYASVFSAKKVVRDFLMHLQRNAAFRNDIVAEGRDMATVVFPDAWKKFYLDASEKERVKRRCLQLREKGMDITRQETLNDVRERDSRDSNRDIAPLKKAGDAIYIDTTDLNLDKVVERIIKAIDI